jgi:hypothetical protein
MVGLIAELNRHEVPTAVAEASSAWLCAACATGMWLNQSRGWVRLSFRSWADRELTPIVAAYMSSGRQPNVQTALM